MNENTATSPTSPRATVAAAAAARQVPRAETGYDAARARRTPLPRRCEGEVDENTERERIRARQQSIREQFSAAFARLDNNEELNRLD